VQQPKLQFIGVELYFEDLETAKRAFKQSAETNQAAKNRTGQETFWMRTVPAATRYRRLGLHSN
jgi:hypothetical protein